MKDSLNYDLTTEVDTGGNGGDITNLLVPGTAISLPNAALLSDPARRAQFKSDLRLLTEILIDPPQEHHCHQPRQPVLVLGPHRAVRQLQRRRRPTSGTTSRATR